MATSPRWTGLDNVRSQSPRDMDEKMSSRDASGEDDSTPKWKTGDRCYAVWAGNGCYYTATVTEVQEEKKQLTVQWDDADNSHRTVPFSQVMEPNEDTTAWSKSRIEKRAKVRDHPEKGRCLFTSEASEPGQVVFVEKPVLVALPAMNKPLWDHLQKLHEATPLNLGTITFHYAALLSRQLLDKEHLDIVRDKFVPEPDEEPGEDVKRILDSLKANMSELLPLDKSYDKSPVCPKDLQLLVSAWRYNSFGHHKEDGLVLYNRISMCAHSCDPSCCWSYGEEDAFVLRSRVSLKEGQELTISYLQDEDLLKSTAVRRAKLQNWRFTCMCERCILEVDLGRGFRCRRCRVGVLYANIVNNTLEACNVCGSTALKDDMKMLIHLEEEYVNRVESLDKTDVADVETVYQAAIDIFERHWILYVMDTILWEAHREKKLQDAMEHQRRRIDFHEHFYPRPTFILAWCHEEFGDCLQSTFVQRKWHYMQEFQRAYQMLAILCGTNHQYTASPYNKLWTAQSSNSNSNGSSNSNSNSRKDAVVAS